MKKTLDRPPFINMCPPVNDGRFEQHKNFDKSTYLANNPRLKAIVPFETYDKREGDLIRKGGDTAVNLGGKS